MWCHRIMHQYGHSFLNYSDCDTETYNCVWINSFWDLSRNESHLTLTSAASLAEQRQYTEYRTHLCTFLSHSRCSRSRDPIKTRCHLDTMMTFSLSLFYLHMQYNKTNKLDIDILCGWIKQCTASERKLSHIKTKLASFTFCWLTPHSLANIFTWRQRYVLLKHEHRFSVPVSAIFAATCFHADSSAASPGQAQTWWADRCHLTTHDQHTSCHQHLTSHTMHNPPTLSSRQLLKTDINWVSSVSIGHAS